MTPEFTLGNEGQLAEEDIATVQPGTNLQLRRDAREMVVAVRSPRRDEILLGATELARQAALETAESSPVGEHLGAVMVAERLVVHRFRSLDAGYPGWVWEVTLARAPRSKKATVSEVDLIPGVGALLAPKWVPWSERLEPSDISRTDVLPYDANDPRLISGFEQVDEEGADVRQIDLIGFGRKRVLSQLGIDQAATRWYDSPAGPVPGLKPSQQCQTCGFLLKLSGSLGTLFGVCANEWSPDDGRAVSLDHGCGAHSETHQSRRRSQWPVVPPRVDDFDLEEIYFERHAAKVEPEEVDTEVADTEDAQTEVVDTEVVDIDAVDGETLVQEPEELVTEELMEESAKESLD